MSFWLELHCDKRLWGKQKVASSSAYSLGEACRSHAVVIPSTSSGNTGQLIYRSKQELEEQARREGWKKVKGEWICDVCVKILEEGPLNEDN